MRGVDDIINTNALKSIDLSELKEASDYQIKKICTAHDIEKTIKEIQDYSSYIADNVLLDYFSSKDKIHEENLEIATFRNNQDSNDEWFNESK